MHRPALLAAALALAACATPIAPSGGPPDRTPPALVGSLPEAGATRVTGRTLRLTFSERLDPAGAQAVTVTPQGDRAPEVRVRGREVEVVLPELREATTYVVTVGTELRDQRGVALAVPLTVAFATGDEIDRGRLGGVVRDPRDGGRGGRPGRVGVRPRRHDGAPRRPRRRPGLPDGDGRRRRVPPGVPPPPDRTTSSPSRTGTGTAAPTTASGSPPRPAPPSPPWLRRRPTRRPTRRAGRPSPPG